MQKDWTKKDQPHKIVLLTGQLRTVSLRKRNERKEADYIYKYTCIYTCIFNKLCAYSYSIVCVYALIIQVSISTERLFRCCYSREWKKSTEYQKCEDLTVWPHLTCRWLRSVNYMFESLSRFLNLLIDFNFYCSPSFANWSFRFDIYLVQYQTNEISVYQLCVCSKRNAEKSKTCSLSGSSLVEFRFLSRPVERRNNFRNHFCSLNIKNFFLFVCSFSKSSICIKSINRKY